MNVVKIFLILPLTITAQLAVTAPVLETQALVQQQTLVSQLTESVAQSSTLISTYNSIKEGIDIYKEVSGFVKDLKLITRSINKTVGLISKSGEVANKLTTLKLKPATMDKAATMIEEILTTNEAYMELLETLLSDDKIKTDDGQRLQLLTDLQEKTKENDSKLENILYLCKQRHEVNRMYEKMFGKY